MANSELTRLLDYLSEQLDSERLHSSEKRCMLSLQGKPVDRPPIIISCPYTKIAGFEPYPHHEIYGNPERMLFNELVNAFDQSILLSTQLSHDLPWTVRANYGTVLLASIFGADVEQVGDNPPWVRHDTGKDLEIEAILEANIGTIEQAGWIPCVREAMEAYHSFLEPYPSLLKMIRITLPDLQGPFDNFEHLRGNDAFLDLIDEPDEVQKALRRVAEVQVETAKALLPLCTDGPSDFTHQHGFMQRGNILLRCDSVIMISADSYRSIIAEYDNWVMEQMGGGAIHSCGNISHLIDAYLELPALKSLDLGQSELNDRTAIYKKARDRDIALIRVHATTEELESGQFQEQFPTGIVAINRAKDFPSAQRLMNRTGRL